jgi:hypothetical protein
VPIDGQVAEYIARRFYSHLLTGCDLAAALLNARNDLLDQYGNPLGALYTIFGESGLYISPS